MFVFLIALLVPPCAGHPSDKAAFLSQDKAALLAQRRRAPFPVERGPGVLSRVLLFPLAEQEWSACCHGSDTAVGQQGQGQDSDCTQDNVKPSVSLREGKKEWKAEEGESEHLCVGNKAFSSTGKVAPGAAFVRATPMEGGVSAPTTQPHCPMP